MTKQQKTAAGEEALAPKPKKTKPEAEVRPIRWARTIAATMRQHKRYARVDMTAQSTRAIEIAMNAYLREEQARTTNSVRLASKRTVSEEQIRDAVRRLNVGDFGVLDCAGRTAVDKYKASLAHSAAAAAADDA